jgi:signal transduction histidine kinase/ligand-binding sensor domain-containing protein
MAGFYTNLTDGPVRSLSVRTTGRCTAGADQGTPLQPQSCKSAILARLPLVLLSLMIAGPVRALDPSHVISQYGHLVWTLQDGQIPGAPMAMVQTADGYIWLGTRTGVVRFDGVRFVPLTPPSGERLLSSRVLSLGTSRDGSLWIGVRGDLERWYDGHLTHYSDAPGSITSISEDRNGKIWFTRAARDSNAPLCEVVGEHSICHGAADGIPCKTLQQVVNGPDGSLWAVSQTTLMHRQRNSTRTWLPSGIQDVDQGHAAALDVLQNVLPTADGAVWVGAAQPSRGLGLLQLVKDKIEPWISPELDGRRLAVSRLLIDRQKALWIGTQNDGVYRLYGQKVSHYGRADGLSSDTVQNLFEDREGTIWVLTTQGIDAFRDLRVSSVTMREGLSAELAHAVLAARDGSVWIDTWHSIDVLRDGKITTLTRRNGLPGDEVMALLADHTGTIWAGIDDGVYEFENDQFKPIDRSIGFVEGMAEDTAGDIWVTTLSPDTLVRIHDRKIVERIGKSTLGFTNGGIVADPHGGIWLSLGNGALGRYRDGRLERIGFNLPPRSVIWGLVAYPDGSIVGATSSGLIGTHNGNTQRLNEADGLPCNEIHTLLIDRHGGLWLYAACGVIFIASDQVQKWWRDPRARLSFRVFDALDGAQPARGNLFPRASIGPDGRLWFANGSVVQMIDPDRLSSNTLPPPVHIEQLIADHHSYAARAGLRLPSRTRDLEIDYTGLSFVVPRKTHFRYRLVGHDSAWHDAESRRQAFYTDLPPKDYRFEVIASNNDGVWNTAGAYLDFSIAPTFYQTRWFEALCALALALAAYLVIRLRVRTVADRIRQRFDVRNAERERIARDLHDTLLQSTQGLIFDVQSAIHKLPTADVSRINLERSLDRAEALTIEGRNRVHSLRSPIDVDLPDALRTAGKEILGDSAMAFDMRCIGNPRKLKAGVFDELYGIAREAIHNAFWHSKAVVLTLEVNYGSKGLTMHVADNGTGIPGDILSQGARPGHWGLQGMRERAGHIGARLDIVSQPNKGTSLRVFIRARLAYR